MRDVEVICASGARFPFLTRTGLPRMRVLKLLRRRFKLWKKPQSLRKFTCYLIDEAYDNFWTGMYAKFQLLTNGILGIVVQSAGGRGGGCGGEGGGC